MTKKKVRPAGKPAKRTRRQATEIRWDPESERRLRERLDSPEGKRIFNELIRILAEVAVDRMLEEAAEEGATKTCE